MNYPREYWEARLGPQEPDRRMEWESRRWPHVPERVQNAIKRVYSAYPASCLPQGLADPMYIMNVIAHELGVGDGEGHFFLPEEGSDEHRRH